MTPFSRWPRAERLNAQRMTDAIQAATGVALRIEGPCPGGQTGAAYVSWPGGRRSVLTFRPGISLTGMREGPLAVIGALRSPGYPVPAAELAVQAGARSPWCGTIPAVRLHLTSGGPGYCLHLSSQVGQAQD